MVSFWNFSFCRGGLCILYPRLHAHNKDEEKGLLSKVDNFSGVSMHLFGTKGLHPCALNQFEVEGMVLHVNI